MMKKFLRIVNAIILYALPAYINAQCVTNVNFNTWQVGGQPGNGNWVVQGGGSTVHQTVNGNPAFFISPFDMMNVHVSGSFRSTDNDDDWMGFVFSYLNPMSAIDTFDCWLYDWKQQQQNGASSGMSLNRILGVIPGGQYTTTFWNHQNTPEFTVIQNNFGSAGWVQGNNHTFELFLTYNRARILVDGVQKFDYQGCFKPGRFGFYNYSQQDCYYSNFQYDLFVDFPFPSRICLGDPIQINFANACVTDLSNYSSATWNFGDGTPSVVINNPTVANTNISHTYTSAGTYTTTLTVVDNTGCSASASHTVTVGSPISLTPILTQPPCNGGNNGSVGVNATGGFGGYAYSWNGGAVTGPTFIGANAGTYTITVTDGVCNTSAQYTLGQPNALTASTSHTDASCGLNNGSATITITGGTLPYSGVTWAGLTATSVNGTTFTTTGLSPGNQIANFHDFNGCSAVLQYTETIGSLPCGVNSTVTSTNVTCFGGNTATATLSVTGVTGTPTIAWSNGVTNNNNPSTISGLTAGTYTYNYSDGNPAHSFSGTVTITQPGAAMVAQVTAIGIACSGINNGQALASVVSGGVPNYNYVWSGGNPNNPSANNLGPGPISVTVTDSRGCTATASGNISGVPSLTPSISTVIDSCFHSAKGKVVVSMSGGNPPYNYSWSNLSTDTTTGGVIAGTYVVTVTDHNSCTVTASGTVNGPATPLTRTFTTQQIACYGQSTGSFNISASGGTPGYTYNWSPNSVSGNNPTGLAAGIYNFTITDTYGCTAIGTDTLRQPAAALSAVTSHTDVTCNGANNGSITLTVSGGTTPYSFLGNPITAGTTTLPNIGPNTYAGNVIDSLGCSVAVSETVSQPIALTASEQHTNVSCNGGSSGSINVTVNGGRPPYSYLWNDGTLTQNRTNIPAGTYSVVVTDSSSCTASVSTIITEPVALTISETHTNVLCNGAIDGVITITTTGGTPTNTFIWNDAITSQNRANLAAGSYSVTVTDNNLCTASVSAVITEPTPLSITEIHTDILCNGAASGTITTIPAGGTPNYTYAWNDGNTNQNRTGLSGGNYTVTVSDNNSCTASVSATISEPTLLTASTSHTDASCNGASDGTLTVTVGGGVQPYSFLGNSVSLGTNTVPGLPAGTYAGNLTDANGCSVALSETISEPPAPIMTVTAVDALCNGGNGSVTANPSGAGPFTYTWSSGGANTQTITPPAGNYTVSATDAASCNQTASFTINEPLAIVVQETHVNVQCFGAATGSITLNVNGGTGATYTYAWSPNVSTTNSATNIAAGSYDITVADANACTVTENIVITQSTVLDVTATTTDATCFGYSDGTITAIGTGGVSPYLYSVSSQNSGTGQFTGLPAGTYTVFVTDANSCLDSTSEIVNEPSQVIALAVPTDVSCYHYTDGQINVSASGGVSGFTYSLSTGAQNSNGLFTGLSTGSYTVTVSDANNCTTSGVAVVNEPDSVLLTVTPDPVTVNLGESVQLQTSTTQTGALIYNWLPSLGLSCYDCASPTFSGNNSVIYTVTMSNANGCTGVSTVHVNVVPNYTVFIPNAFTPNGDGVNDFWQLFGNMKGIKQLEVKVFNRWGEKVFESTDVNFAWDGSFKGTVVPAVYSYVAKFVWLDNHSDNNYKGTITVLK